MARGEMRDAVPPQGRHRHARETPRANGDHCYGKNSSCGMPAIVSTHRRTHHKLTGRDVRAAASGNGPALVGGRAPSMGEAGRRSSWSASDPSKFAGIEAGPSREDVQRRGSRCASATGGVRLIEVGRPTRRGGTRAGPPCGPRGVAVTRETSSVAGADPRSELGGPVSNWNRGLRPAGSRWDVGMWIVPATDRISRGLDEGARDEGYFERLYGGMRGVSRRWSLTPMRAGALEARSTGGPIWGEGGGRRLSLSNIANIFAEMLGRRGGRLLKSSLRRSSRWGGPGGARA